MQLLIRQVVIAEVLDKSQEYQYFVWCLKDVGGPAEIFHTERWQPSLFPTGVEAKQMFCAVSQVCDILRDKPQTELQRTEPRQFVLYFTVGYGLEMRSI